MAGRIVILARDPMRQSSCSTWDGKWKFQPMQCNTLKEIAVSGRTNIKGPGSNDCVGA